MSLPQNPFTSSSVPSRDASSSQASGKRGKRTLVDHQVDRISQLPDHVLVEILTRLCTEEAVQTSTLSKRWNGVWKQMPVLCFDMQYTTNLPPIPERSAFIAQLITKVINNHNAHLECCKIQHYSYQSKDGTLETWVRSLTRVKETKFLALQNIRGHSRMRASVLHLPPNMFSHPSLTSLFLFRYDLESPHAFNNSHNLMVLKLDKVCAEVDVFNAVIASCPSLKVLVLDITWYKRIGCLKIHNDNLKLLHLSCTIVDRIQVSAARLDILSVNCSFVTRDNFHLVAPRILRFSKTDWVADENMPHISYNVSCDDQGNENIGHELVPNRNSYYFRPFASLVVSVDMMNPKEVYMLKEAFDAWGREISKLEIFFKHNIVSKEEGESSMDGAQKKKKWRSFSLNAEFRARVVWMHDFSGLNNDEFALASCFVTQGTMVRKLMIKTSSIPSDKKLEMQLAVSELMELPRGNKNLSIECF